MYRSFLILSFIFLLLTSTTGAQETAPTNTPTPPAKPKAAPISPKLIQKVKKLNQKIADLQSTQKALQKEEIKTQKEKKRLEKEQKRMQQKLSSQMESFHHMTRSLVHAANKPKEATTLHHIFTNQQTRPTLWQQVHRYAEEKLTKDQKTLANILQNYQEQKKKEQYLQELTQKKKAQQKSIQKTRKKYLNSIKIHDKSLAKELSFIPKKKASNLAIKTPQTKAHLPIAGIPLPTNNTSIRIQSAAGTPVPIQHAGTVLFSGLFRDFGHLFIVRISPETQLIYKGLSALRYQVGDTVKPLDVIGFLPNIPKPELHITAHHKGQTTSPKRWLNALE